MVIFRCSLGNPRRARFRAFHRAASAFELDQSAVTFKLPEQIEWKDPLGWRERPRFCPATRSLGSVIKWLPGGFSRPHFHPNDRFFIAAKGRGGTGRKFDPNNTVPRLDSSPSRRAGALTRQDEEAIIFLSGEAGDHDQAEEEK